MPTITDLGDAVADAIEFVPGDAATWIARGREPDHAKALAKAWRDFPDLPADRPLDERMARTRERVMAMRPVHDAISADGEARRRARNFAFMEAKARRHDRQGRSCDPARPRSPWLRLGRCGPVRRRLVRRARRLELRSSTTLRYPP